MEKFLLFLRSPKGDVWSRHWLRPGSCHLDFRPTPSLRPKLSSNSDPVLYSVLVVSGKHQAEQESQAAHMARVVALAISCLPSICLMPHGFLVNPPLSSPSLIIPTDCLCISSGGFSLPMLLPWLYHLGAAFTLAALWLNFHPPLFLQLFWT